MALMDMDDAKWRDRQAGVARFMVFKKGAVVATHDHVHDVSVSITSEAFCTEWLDCSCDERKSTFKKSSIYEEYGDLKEHRTEQAMLTNLGHKYGVMLHREADQWGNGYEKDFPYDTYGQIFESTGVYSYDPSGNRHGSSFRNV